MVRDDEPSMDKIKRSVDHGGCNSPGFFAKVIGRTKDILLVYLCLY